MRVRLFNSASGMERIAHLKPPKQNSWADATVEIETKGLPSADEIQVLLPDGAEALIDDLLLYEPEK
jgi:hypothetical protein